MINPIYHKQAELLLRILPIMMKIEEFALKGGTAINFFIRDLPRLSVDIDLCYLPIQDRATSIEGIHNRLNQLKQEIVRLIHGTQATEVQNSELGTIKLIIRWRGVSVKIEPNFVLRGAVFPIEEQELTKRAAELFELAADCRTLSIQDLYGSKICAALDRQHPRDLFDIKLLLDNEGITNEIRQAFIVYLISHPRSIADLLAPNQKEIGPTFENEFDGMTIDTVSIMELEEARESLVARIHDDLTNRERKFILSVKQGIPDWDLFGYSHIQDLPAVRWKLLNISRMGKTLHEKAVSKLRTILEL